MQDCFLLDVSLNGKKLEIYIDTDQGVKFWECQKLSRAIEEVLDEKGTLGEDYLLEVSSPGIDKPLQLQRQFPRNIGRTLRLELDEEVVKEGKLLEIAEDGALKMKVQGVKKGQFKEEVIPFEEIKSATVLVSFKKKKK